MCQTYACGTVCFVFRLTPAWRCHPLRVVFLLCVDSVPSATHVTASMAQACVGRGLGAKMVTSHLDQEPQFWRPQVLLERNAMPSLS